MNTPAKRWSSSEEEVIYIPGQGGDVQARLPDGHQFTLRAQQVIPISDRPDDFPTIYVGATPVGEPIGDLIYVLLQALNTAALSTSPVRPNPYAHLTDEQIARIRVRAIECREADLLDNANMFATKMIAKMTVEEQLDTIGWGCRSEEGCDLGFNPMTGKPAEGDAEDGH